MKEINNYIVEKFKISKDIKNVNPASKDFSINEVESKASKGAAINVDLNGKYVFMMYDPNSGICNCFDCNSYKDLINDWGYVDSEAKKITSLKYGKSYEDASGAVYTRINED